MSKRILVVDDSRVIAMKTCLVLKKHGYVPTSIGEPLDTQSFLASNPVDLVILDIEMPGMNGFEVCEKLRENPLFEALPVLFLTSRNDHLERLKGFSVGGQAFITKDYEEADFIGMVQKLVPA